MRLERSCVRKSRLSFLEPVRTHVPPPLQRVKPIAQHMGQQLGVGIVAYQEHLTWANSARWINGAVGVTNCHCE